MIVYELLVIIIKYNKLNYIIIALTRTIFLDGACKNKKQKCRGSECSECSVQSYRILAHGSLRYEKIKFEFIRIA